MRSSGVIVEEREADNLNVELTAKTLETPLTTESLILALRPTLASKQYGAEDLLAKLVAEAVLAVMPRDPTKVRSDGGGFGNES